MYDAQAAFEAVSSWTTFNAAQITAQASPYQGMLFDGQYLYALAATTLLRLEVKTAPGPLPALPGFHGSFF
jgi:hypothetical protein